MNPPLNCKNRRQWLFIILYITFFFPIIINAQPELAPGTILNFEAAIPTTHTRAYTTDPIVDVAWSFTAVGGAPSGVFVADPGFGNTVNINYTPTAGSALCTGDPADGDEYTLTINDPVVSGPMGMNTYTLRGCQTPPTATNPVDVVFVVDISGSMRDVAICECIEPSPPGSTCMENPNPDGVSKMNYLKEKIHTLFTSLQPSLMVNSENDFGLVTFASSLGPSIPLTRFDNVGLAGDVSRLMSMDETIGLTPGGSTGMGAGLRQAIDMLGGVADDDTRSRVILLISNGKQNRPPPRISELGGVLQIDADPPDRAAVTLSGTDIIILPIAIFTPEGEYLELLQGLSDIGGATALGLTSFPYICEVGPNLTESLTNGIIALGSPKLIHFRTGELNGTSGEEIFSITENLDMLTVNVSSVGSHNYTDLTVEKINGATTVDITSLGTITPPFDTPSQHRVFNITFPIAIPNGTNTAGDYRFKFTADRPDLSYESAVIIDDRGLKQNFFATPINAAGEDMRLGTYLAQAGNPVKDANVTAYIYRPKTALNPKLAKTKVPGKYKKVKGPWGNLFGGKKLRDKSGIFGVSDNQKEAVFNNGGDGGYIKTITITHPTLPSFQQEGSYMSNGEKKYLILLNETGLAAAFKQELIETIPMTHEGGGVYRGVFKGTEKTGLYHTRFEAKGIYPQIGTYLRSEEKTPVVRFGTPDLKKSKLFELYEDPVIISMKPIDVEGNLLGPNQVSAIDFKLSVGSADTPVDYLDGRYLVRLLLDANEPDPNVTIRIHKRILYNGPLSKIRQKRCFFSIHGGQTLPQNDLEALKKESYFGEAKLGCRFSKRFGVLAKGGYYTFKDQITDEVDFDIVGVGIGLNYRVWMNFLTGIYLQPEVLATYYKPEDTDWAFGYDAGLSLVKPLNHYVSFSLDGNYHRIDTSPEDTEFYTVGIGLQVRF